MNNTDYRIEYYSDTIVPEWDSFVAQIDGDIKQTSVWAQYQLQSHGLHSHFIVVHCNGAVAGGCRITTHRFPLLGNVGNVEHGPVYLNQSTAATVVAEMQKLAKQLKLSYLTAIVDYKNVDALSALTAARFRPKEVDYPPRQSPRLESTLLLDLTPPLDNILGQMKTMRKRGIKKGLQTGFSVRKGSRDDVPAFFDLLLETNKRYGSQPIIESLAEAFVLWDCLAPRNMTALYMGEVNSKTICSALCFRFGSTFRYAHWGWTGECAELHVSDVIQWEMIKAAKEEGFMLYDFVQIEPRCAAAIRSGQPVPDHLRSSRFYGPTLFKLQFGGTLVNYPDHFIYYPNKIKWFVFGTMGNLLLNRLKLLVILRNSYGFVRKTLPCKLKKLLGKR